MRLARAGVAQRQHVLSPVERRRAGQLQHQAFVHRRDRAELEGLETLQDREPGGLDAPLDGALFAIEQLQLAEAEQVARTVQPFLGALPRHFVVFAQEGGQAQGLEMGVQQQGRFGHHSAPAPSSVR